MQYLRAIDRKSEEIEDKLHISQKNQELIELLELEKSLVYFTTSLRSNEVVLEKMLRTEQIKKYTKELMYPEKFYFNGNEIVGKKFNPNNREHER